MSNLAEILGDVVFRSLDPTSLDACPSPSMGSVTSDCLNEWSSTSSKQTKLLRSQSEPVLGPMVNFTGPIKTHQRPQMLWTRSSYGSDEVIQVNDSVEDGGVENLEDVEDEEEEDVSPVSSNYPTHVTCSNPFIHRVHHQEHNFLSSSLPASMSRTTTTERATQELLQLTQPLREGVMSRERLLPASRMKQVGVGGRGKRHASLVGQTLPVISLDSPVEPALDWAGSVKTITPSTSLIGLNQNLTSNGVPLVAPRPIRGWQRGIS
ncbi:uncharacterized protein MELLADRAFT_73113 [Melampsora larici-populina 98AG31]|uniref:Uncharacterized protein n=1 Tax=Melampsora larici-populina (strain 98AG31 / pathotype 3-4-7) TaxID=747676 RepID=F4S3C1_MELLP|nr:uncharacterized protein MELLADRAFT_73113 [Melampsora larici-populina 98AG31]EGG00866.1 hypothetical protein MELLADRAFT_73113 [Melampsora larici-populina 98AG31]